MTDAERLAHHTNEAAQNAATFAYTAVMMIKLGHLRLAAEMQRYAAEYSCVAMRYRLDKIALDAQHE